MRLFLSLLKAEFLNLGAFDRWAGSSCVWGLNCALQGLAQPPLASIHCMSGALPHLKPSTPSTPVNIAKCPLGEGKEAKISLKSDKRCNYVKEESIVERKSEKEDNWFSRCSDCLILFSSPDQSSMPPQCRCQITPAMRTLCPQGGCNQRQVSQLHLNFR